MPTTAAADTQNRSDRPRGRSERDVRGVRSSLPCTRMGGSGMIETKLIIIDGMSGSGKSTAGKLVSCRMNALGIPNRFYYELQEEHPLRVYGRSYKSFADHEVAKDFVRRVEALFEAFVKDHMAKKEVAILDAFLYQDTLMFAFMLGMDAGMLQDLTKSLYKKLMQLDPVLIFYYQLDPENAWRRICKERGPEWVHYMDDEAELVEAGQAWRKRQDFMFAKVQQWEMRRLVIENEDYLWDEHIDKIMRFLEI